MDITGIPDKHSKILLKTCKSIQRYNIDIFKKKHDKYQYMHIKKNSFFNIFKKSVKKRE